MFKVGQKFRADAIRMSDDEEFTVTALYVELEVIDWTKVTLCVYQIILLTICKVISLLLNKAARHRSQC